MSGFATAFAALAWLAGISVLLRYPIVTVGAGAALAAWTWDPGGFWLLVLATGVVSLARREFGPQERFLVAFPELAVALVAAVVAVLAGGQLAAGALAVLVLALGWFVRARVIGLAGTPRRPAEQPAAPARPVRRSPAPTSGFLGEASIRVDAAPCPDCGGLLVATGHTAHDPARGPVFLAHAHCTACGRRLVGLGDSTKPGAGITWVDPDERSEDIA